MDDSVIKVLRRNGSWENTTKTQDSKKYEKQDIPKFKNLEEDFHLDEKFEILAKEIKKRMNQRGSTTIINLIKFQRVILLKLMKNRFQKIIFKI